MTLLSVADLDVRHGLLHAVRGVSLHVEQGETIALVGANGAGKTTLLRALAGAHLPAAGQVLFAGADLTHVPAYRRVGAGIAASRLPASFAIGPFSFMARPRTAAAHWGAGEW